MKNKIVLSTTLALLLALGIQTSTVHADTTSTTSTSVVPASTTRTSVVPGSLKINSVPNMTFNSTVDEIANSTSTTAKLVSNGSISTTDDEGYGTATKWTLAATPTVLSYTGGDGKTNSLNVSKLTIAGTPITTIDGKTSTQIVKNGTKEGNTSTDLTADNTSITLPQDQQVFGSDYTGAITWTLSGNTGAIGGTAQ